MRIALITLAVAALAFIGSIIWIFASKNGIEIIPSQKVTTVKVSNETAALEILRSQWKTEDRIKDLETKIDALSSGKNTPALPQVTPDGNAPNNSGTGGSQKPLPTATGSTIIPISAKFLTHIITKVTLTLDKNNGIFGLYTFDTNTEYSTYTDPKFNLTIIASRNSYDTWLKNFRALDKEIYTINETKTFSFPSFYINPTKPDNTIRLAMQVEAQTLLISLPKNRYTEFKNMMNKK